MLVRPRYLAAICWWGLALAQSTGCLPASRCRSDSDCQAPNTCNNGLCTRPACVGAGCACTHECSQGERGCHSDGRPWHCSQEEGCWKRQAESCAADQRCVEGTCACIQPCAAGEVGCSSASVEWTCGDPDRNGCRQKVETACPDGGACTPGSGCGACTSECSSGQKGCDELGNRSWTCVAAGPCWIRQYQNCALQETCVPGTGCTTACTSNCSTGEQGCDTQQNRSWTCAAVGNCLQRQYKACATNETCVPGTGCVVPCTSECSQGEKGCDDPGNRAWTCVAAGECWKREYQSCSAEQTCHQGSCCECVAGPCCDGCHLSPEGTDCDDGQSCTHGDSCRTGRCAGDAYSCDDHDPCAQDLCDGAGLCTHPPAQASCDDGVFCNGLDACADGVCTPVGPRPCSAPDACDESADGCIRMPTWDSLAAGLRHTCALSTDNRVFCWGENTYGQLGNGTNQPSQVPVEVTSTLFAGSDLQTVTAGKYHSCVLSGAGSVYCWGNGVQGQLGDGLGTSSLVPVKVDISASGAFIQIGAGGNMTCGAGADHEGYCWGANMYGQHGGVDCCTNVLVPTMVNRIQVGTGPITAMVTSGYHSCLLSYDGLPLCWGWDAMGQVGNGTAFGDWSHPGLLNWSSVPGGQMDFTAVAVGSQHSCGIGGTNAVCWGDGENGKLGTGHDQPAQGPVVVASSPLSGSTLRTLALGDNHSCVCRTDGAVFCWGAGTSGQLGNGWFDNSAVPVLVDVTSIGSPRFVAVTAGSAHTCGLTEDGRVFCWGSDSNGQLGNGTRWGTDVPEAVTLGE